MKVSLSWSFTSILILLTVSVLVGVFIDIDVGLCYTHVLWWSFQWTSNQSLRFAISVHKAYLICFYDCIVFHSVAPVFQNLFNPSHFDEHLGFSVHEKYCCILPRVCVFSLCTDPLA